MPTDSASAIEMISGVPVGAPVPYEYNLLLVALSFLISVLGSYVALEMATERRRGNDTVTGPAFALGGCAIWAMHFIGMAAYTTPLRVSYSLFPTLASLVLAVGVTGFGFAIAQRDPSDRRNLLIGGVSIGGGVLTMHYLGMFGMDIRATTEWRLAVVAASVLIAVSAATAALWFAFTVTRRWQRALAAVAMGVAVCAMHYTGMAAAIFVCSANGSPSQYVLEGAYLPHIVFALALVSLATSMAYTRFDKAIGPR
ncbi:MHYT domain-containing protein [Methylibium sp.]|uniref:MHYT domain-containing protein n=1 Tax=Methylibium sp. TaxID=2067992 RepID=UPI003D14B917